MKSSRFNIFIKDLNNTKLAFNSLSCGLAEVNDEFFKIINNIDNINIEMLNEQEKQIYEAAIDGGFIVENEFDELLDFETKRNFQKYSKDQLGLTIAPTLNCNFKCVYCYETSKCGLMNKNIQNDLINFVKNQSSHIKHLDVTWYGGEPLLGKSIVYGLSEEFIKICKENDIRYTAFIITNGSLLTDEDIESFIKYNILGAQITIDGPRDVHNSRRISKDNKNTFDIIIDNINKLLKANIEVIIRINVDKTNVDNLEELFYILSNRLVNKNVKINFGQVTAYTEACKTIEKNCYNNIEYSSMIFELQKYISKYGFEDYNPMSYPEAKYNYCCADFGNSFVVDHEGYFYKCWNDVGNITNSIGNINDKTLDIWGSKHGKWLLRTPTSIDKCSECNLLPICVGGCPHKPITEGVEPICDMYKYNIEKILLYHYNKKIN